MIGTFAHDVLDAVAGYLGDAAPDRRYVAHSRPAGDLCEELVVYVEPVLNTSTSRHFVSHEATVFVDLTRCHPTATDQVPIPPADQLDAAAVALADDAWRMWRGLTRAASGPAAPFGRCETVIPVDLTPLPPEGGFATWRAQIRATITPAAGT